MKALGHGFSEAIYQKALMLELQTSGIKAEREVRFPVRYRDIEIGAYIADLVVNGSIIVELKAIDGPLQKAHLGQYLNYMRMSKVETGLVINFGRPRLEWNRLKLSQCSSPKPICVHLR